MRTPRVLVLVGLLAAPGPRPAAADDPLPEGAKLRLGTGRMRNPFSWPHGVLTPDGRHLATFQNGKNVLLDVTTGAAADTLPDSVSVYSADGKWVASAHGVVRLWEVGTGAKREAPKRQFSNVALSPVSLSADGRVLAVGFEAGGFGVKPPPTAVVWDAAAGRQLAEVAPEQNALVGVRISPDGKTLATFGTHTDPKRKYGARNPDGWPEQAVQLWDAATGKALARVAVPGPLVAGVAFSPDGTLLAVSAGDGLVSLRDSRTGEEKRQLFGRSYLGSRLAFSPDGKTLAGAGMDGRIQRWNVADGKILGATDPPVGPQGGYSFRFHDLVCTGPDRAVAWGNLGAAAVVWEVPSGKRLSPIGGHSQPVTSVGFTADGKHVLTTGSDYAVLRWDAATGELLGPAVVRPPWNGTALPTIRVFADASRGVSDRVGTSVYDLATGAELFRLPVRENSRGAGYVVRATPDGSKAVTRLNNSDDDPATHLEAWDLVTPKRLGGVEVRAGGWLSADVSADGKRLVTVLPLGPDTREVAGWDLATGKRLGQPQNVLKATGVVAVPGAGSLALLPTTTGDLVVADYATGKVEKTIAARREDVTGLPVFAPDGKSFAVAFGPGRATGLKPKAEPPEVRVYDWPVAELRHRFAGHTSAVTCLTFSPDGKTLASGSEDTTILLWDLTKK